MYKGRRFDVHTGEGSMYKGECSMYKQVKIECKAIPSNPLENHGFGDFNSIAYEAKKISILY